MDSQDKALSNLYFYREQIEHNLAEIEAILAVNFPEESSVAKQHWIVQIKTALKDNLPYLPRGEYSMDYTLNRIQDKVFGRYDKGVSKYIN
jgi:hypothetical protein